MMQQQLTPLIAKPGRSRIWNILLALVIFVSGLGTGIGLTVRFMSNTFRMSFQSVPAQADQITHRLQRRLDLTDEQAARVREILLTNLTAFRALRAEYRPQVVTRLQQTKRELETVLTPEQTRKMEGRFRYLLKFWMLPEANGESTASQ